MNVNRFVSLVAAVVISGLQWAPFFGTALQLPSMRVVGPSGAQPSGCAHQCEDTYRERTSRAGRA